MIPKKEKVSLVNAKKSVKGGKKVTGWVSLLKKQLIVFVLFILVFVSAYYLADSLIDTRNNDKARAASNVWGAIGNPEVFGYGQVDYESTIRNMSNVTRAQRVRPGTNHTLVIMNDGTVWSTGLNQNGQLGNGKVQYTNSITKVEGLTGIIDAEAGSDFSVVLKGDGTVWTWGSSKNGKLGYNVPNFDNQLTPVVVPGLTGVVKIAVGANHTLALRNDNTVWTWGNNLYGQLGNGNTSDSSVPTKVAGLANVVGIEAGDSFSVALLSDGTVRTWGRNNSNQLGLDIDPDASGNQFKTSPQQVIGLTSVSSLGEMSPSSQSVMVIDSSGYMWQWGYRASGKTSSLYDNNAPCYGTAFPCRIRQMNLVTGVIKIAYANSGVLYQRSNNSVFYNGYGDQGQKADGTLANVVTQVDLTTQLGGGVTGLGIASTSLYTTKSDGTIKVWASNEYNQLGYNPTPKYKFDPFAANIDNTFIEYTTLSGGGGMAIKDDGTNQNKGKIWTWGPNNFGQLGLGTISNTPLLTPQEISSLSNITQVSAQPQTANMALDSQGRVWAWGRNHVGQVPGQSGSVSSPVLVDGFPGGVTFKKVKAGCALATNNDLYCWGMQRNFEFGINNNGDKSTPVLVNQNVLDWDRSSDVSIGVMIIAKADGTVWTAGSADSGWLGNGSLTNNQPSWVQIGGLTGITQVSLGKALRNTGTLYSWGTSNVGNGSDQAQLNPVTITTPETPQSIRRLRFISTTGNLFEYTNAGSLSPAKVPYISNVSRFGAGNTNGGTFRGDIVDIITTGQIPGITFTCEPALAGTTTTCTFQLPNLTRVDESFKMGVANTSTNVVPGGNCTSNSTGFTTCTSVPVGPYVGTTESQFYNIYAQVANEAITDTGEDSLVYNPNFANIKTVENSEDCTSANIVSIGDTYNCTFPLTGNSTNTFSLPSGGIVGRTEQGSTVSGNSSACTIINNTTPQVTLSCTTIPTFGGAGSFTSGSANITLRFGGTGNFVDKGDITLTQGGNPTALFISPSTVTFGPTEASAVRFQAQNLTLTVGGGNNNDSRFTANGATAVCKFKLKEYGAADTDPIRGYDSRTQKLVAATTGGSYNAGTKTFDVPYSSTNGCNIRLPATNQNQPKWLFEIRVVRSDNQIFARDNAYFFLYGAIGTVTIS